MSSDEAEVSDSSQEPEKAEGLEKALLEKMEKRKAKKEKRQKEKEANRKIKKSFKDILHISEYGL